MLYQYIDMYLGILLGTMVAVAINSFILNLSWIVMFIVGMVLWGLLYYFRHIIWHYMRDNLSHEYSMALGMECKEDNCKWRFNN